MNGMIDHTSEVERRISAIVISPRDCCAFHRLRDNALSAMKECWYCAHAEFDQENDDLHQQGYCKFRK